MTSDRVVSDLMLPFFGEVLWLFLDAWDSVRLRATSSQWIPGTYGPYGEIFFFLLKKEPMVVRSWFGLGPASQMKQWKHVPWMGCT